jgi:hypothetical protein
MQKYGQADVYLHAFLTSEVDGAEVLSPSSVDKHAADNEWSIAEQKSQKF